MVIRKTVEYIRSVWSDNIDAMHCFKGGESTGKSTWKKNRFTDGLMDTDCE